MDTMNVDLHALANAPGAGKAAKALRDAGHWQEIAADDLPIWDVELTVEIEARVRVQVRASCEDGARLLAKQLADKGKLDDTHDYDHETFSRWRVTDVDAANHTWGDALGPEDLAKK
jgi:hypothetical protein